MFCGICAVSFFFFFFFFGALGDLKCLVEFWKIPNFWCIWGDVKLFCDFYWKCRQMIPTFDHL
jgi:hypothetical protein